MNLKELSLDEKIGQKLMVGLDIENAKDIAYELISKYKIGGILLYKKNYQNYKEMIDLINYIKEINSKYSKIPMIIAIDQEGGRVNRLPNDFIKMPSCYKISQKNDENLLRESASITAEILENSGINMDFAPVLDIKRFGDLQAIGDRAFSENKDIVTKNGIIFMKELQKRNIISVIKHFPGHGATKTDSHFFIPAINKEIKELEEDDEYPFLKAIDNGADTLLIGHLLIKKISNKYPITMSDNFIKKYLRDRFKGVIITDDMRMKSLSLFYGKYEPIIKAFSSGNDIILFKYKNNDKIYKKLKNIAKKNSTLIKEINESVARIINLKEKYNVNDNLMDIDTDINKYNERIQKIRDEVL